MSDAHDLLLSEPPAKRTKWQELGKVYVASKKMRGPHAVKPNGSMKIDVTSAQPLMAEHRLDFSPMTPIEGGYEGYLCFENYWQSLKRYKNMDKETTAKVAAWWLKQTKGKRRCPITKGYEVSHADIDGKKVGYVDSRKLCYVPRYEALCAQTKSIDACIKRRIAGKDQAFYDFDGPRGPKGELLCVEVTPEMLREYIEIETTPFGHGFVVAAMAAGIPSHVYTGVQPVD